jgi:uncharacterized protein YndB with AHSA1/START domain
VTGQLVLTTPSEREIVLAREFDAPRRLVFEAFTKPELLVRWYGASGWQLVVCEIDLRIGGAWRYLSEGPDGATMGQSGTYLEITRPDRLVVTEEFDDQSYPGKTTITHEFVERDERTTVTTTLRFATAAGRDIVLGYPMARGVGESYERLSAVLAERRGTSARESAQPQSRRHELNP